MGLAAGGGRRPACCGSAATRAPVLPATRPAQVYSSGTAPFALKYFGSGEKFNRALSLWARHARERARRRHPAATGFKLSDAKLVPVCQAKGAWGRASAAWCQHCLQRRGGMCCLGAGGAGPQGEGRHAHHSSAQVATSPTLPAPPALLLLPHPNAESGRSHKGSAPDAYVLSQGGDGAAAHVLSQSSPPASPAAAATHGGGGGGEARRWRWGPASKAEELGPEVPCTSETDIFEALGLAYVPLHMRTEI